MKVYGIGEKKTPTPFIAACDKFIYLEILKPVESVVKQIVTAKVKSKTRTKAKESVQAPPANAIEVANKGLAKVISDSINDLADENGWAFLGDLGNLILKKQPDFDPRNYGFKKLVPLIKSFDQFEIDERESGKKNTILVFVRTK
jgi:Fe-S-cluster formation regulator IscX/YfhJ